VLVVNALSSCGFYLSSKGGRPDPEEASSSLQVVATVREDDSALLALASSSISSNGSFSWAAAADQPMRPAGCLRPAVWVLHRLYDRR